MSVYVCVSLCACMCAHIMGVGVCGAQTRALNPLELELYAFPDPDVVLGTDLGSSVRTASVLNG